MLITRAPFRIPLGGGGTDIPVYAAERGGALITAAINQYIYISIHRRLLDELIWLSYSERETQTRVDDVKHPLIREALRTTGVDRSIEIHSMTELSAQVGLGTSSSFLTALLHGLYTYLDKPVSRQQLAQRATEIERIRLGHDGGIQDQYVASYGGFCSIENSSLSDVRVEQLHLAPGTVERLSRNLLLFYTGVNRCSSSVVARQQAENAKEAILTHYDSIKNIGLRAKDALLNDDLEAFGKTFDEHWQLKRRFSSDMTNDRFDWLYNRALLNGALGGKIIGAGGGGFFLFCVQDWRADSVRRALNEAGLIEVPFQFDFEGTTTVINKEMIVSAAADRAATRTRQSLELEALGS